jgi:UDP-N-acetylmuramate--L-alanine ligase/UDP-N-acetylenolpyruvoylglucosamine reductase
MNTPTIPQNSPSTLPQRIQTGIGHVHFAGICGIGMAGLAILLKSRGFTVSGCDLMINKLAGWLRERDIMVVERHSPTHLTADVQWVVRSAAVPETSEEIQAAISRGIPVFKRGEVLAALLGETSFVAVAGTHGKTTTSSFIAQILTLTGRAPSFCIGGEAGPLGGVAGIGTGGITVVEADESDGTLALYSPDIAVVTNVEFDHMEHFEGIDAFEECFRTFIRQTRRRILYCVDDPRAAKICGAHPHAASFGFSKEADLRAEPLRETASGTEFRLTRAGTPLGLFTVPAPGRHNVLNALACLAVGLELEIPLSLLQGAMAKVALPRRRFERIIDRADLVVISDYAHHPSEIAALVTATGHLHRPRSLAVFQPHRYTRTRALGPDFPPAFKGLDEVVLCPVYAASEPPLAGGSIWDLYALCRNPPDLNIKVASSLRNAWDYSRGQLQIGDAFLVIGAGDVERIAGWARDDLGRKRIEELASPVSRAIREIDLQSTLIKGREPLAHRTTLGVGGHADLWMEVANEDDLLKIAKWTRAAMIPFQILGGGSNVLISDLGVRGVVARLAGEPFRRISEREKLVVAGAGTPLTKLLTWCADQGLAGLEFLESIPGTVGGAVKGNAGAWGKSIADTLAWVRFIDRDDRISLIHRHDLDFGYRSCPALRDQIILEAAFQLTPGNPDTILRERTELAQRRVWMKGLRSAGSIFKNPPGGFAGQLIEQAGFKGFSVGGASISSHHANVIVTTPLARASDVMAVLEITRAEVHRQSGIRLETEIQILE